MAADRELVAEPDFTHCYGCGADNEGGLALRFYADDAAGSVETRWTPEGRFAGYRRMVHGGVIATLLDEAMGWALWGLAGKMGVTRELLTRYHRPMFLGRPYRVLGRLDRVEAETAVVLAEVRDERGRLAAEGRGEFALVARDKVRDRADARGAG